jgi:hypothetical protein
MASGKLHATLRVATSKLRRSASLSLGVSHIMLKAGYTRVQGFIR